MTSESNQILKFVQFIEEDIDVLTKSQTKEHKQKKSVAADRITSKWKEFNGQILDHRSLLKKINNLKSRAKAAQISGKALNDWQTKILEIVGSDFRVDVERNEDHPKVDKAQNDAHISDEATSSFSETASDQVLQEHETDDTRLLSDEQLKRLVLLKQIKVLTLQQQRLERLSGQVVAEKDVVFDFVGFD